MRELMGADGMPGREVDAQGMNEMEYSESSLFQSCGLSQWYVLRVHRKIEMAERLLLLDSMHYFIPRYYSIRTYHGRKYRSLVPLIPNCIFVRGTWKDVHALKRRYNSVFQYLLVQKQGELCRNMTVDDKAMRDFMEVASHYDDDLVYLTPEEAGKLKNVRVRIHGGVFDGVEGILLQHRGKSKKRVVVYIEGFPAIGTAELEPDLLEIIK